MFRPLYLRAPSNDREMALSGGFRNFLKGYWVEAADRVNTWRAPLSCYWSGVDRTSQRYHFCFHSLLYDIQARFNALPSSSNTLTPACVNTSAFPWFARPFAELRSRDHPFSYPAQQLCTISSNLLALMVLSAHPTVVGVYLPFLLSASLFLNGKPLVLLSAPVFLLILPLLLANKIHQKAIAAKKVEPSVPKLKERTPVSVHMA
jgi:hypothetical protein